MSNGTLAGPEPAFAHVARCAALGTGQALLVAGLVALPVWLATAVEGEVILLGGLLGAAFFGAIVGIAVGCATLPIEAEPVAAVEAPAAPADAAEREAA